MTPSHPPKRTITARRLFLLFLSVCALLYGAFSAKEHFELASISKSIPSSAALKLYEGLPHQSWESDLLKKELAEKKTVLLHGFPFYERPLSVTAADVETLRRLSTARGSFSAYRGPKA